MCYLGVPPDNGPAQNDSVNNDHGLGPNNTYLEEFDDGTNAVENLGDGSEEAQSQNGTTAWSSDPSQNGTTAWGDFDGGSGQAQNSSDGWALESDTDQNDNGSGSSAELNNETGQAQSSSDGLDGIDNGSGQPQNNSEGLGEIDNGSGSAQNDSTSDPDEGDENENVPDPFPDSQNETQSGAQDDQTEVKDVNHTLRYALMDIPHFSALFQISVLTTSHALLIRHLGETL